MNNRVAEFFADRRGNFAAIGAILLPMLLLSGAMALNVSDMNNRKSEYQQSLDSGVLAAAAMPGLTVAERVAIAESYFVANTDQYCSQKSYDIRIEGDTVYGDFTCRYRAILDGVLKREWLDIRVTSAARLGTTGDPLCIVSLNKTAKRSFLESGKSHVTGNGCRVHVNSANVEAVTLSGGSTLTSTENCIVGGVKQGLTSITPRPPAACEQIDDPFAAIAKPAVGTCDYYNFTANANMTLYPGVYCGGMRISNATFDLKPGLYVIKDGILESTGGATIRGDGVTFFLTGIDAGVVFSGGGKYQLSAMTTGSLAGFVVYLDPNAVKQDKSTVSGGGDTYYEGAMYFPEQTLLISGGGTVTTPSPFTAYVADMIEFTGGSQLTIGIDPSATKVPVPRGFFEAGAPILIQ
ncbi:TadE/TadG family type IV pilus assembly protein [Oricola cellulosilytica]|uniref:Putative Flp pilus-assembly TadG-like N-terminal domain-containing protein n=1 Tax=Oricola cellulosilytica TaxID=1429082 RepID=A0A4R0PCI4_9HYPH|nr:pilus assembly protein TadG-related protein [Oricola cellulosilytica]TCD14243.1 hypothetical protein E0D97_09180 [Oricola cellulosilytica]